MEIYIPIIILYCRSAKSELLFTCHILLSPSFLLCCEWMHECLQAVVIHLLFVYFYTTSQGHSVDLQLLYLYFFAITVPDKI